MTQTEQIPARLLDTLLHAVFFLSGIATVLIGQILPVLSARFSLNDLQSGYLFPAQFAGSLTGTLLTNWFGRSGRLVHASVIGSFLMAAGLFIMNVDAFPIVLAGFTVNGLGIGLTLPAINVLILERNPLRPAAALSFLNFFWGLGAIVSKPFVDATSGETSLLLTTALLAAPLTAAAVLMLFTPVSSEAKVGRGEVDSPAVRPIWSMPVAWAIAAFNFIHVGFESGIGGWLTTYAIRVEGVASTEIISPTFLFFLFFVIGRGVAPVFFKFLDENKMLLLSLFTILGGLAIVLTAVEVIQLSLGSAFCGLGTSSVFPTNVSRFSKIFGSDAMRRATPLFICGTLGATVITWLIGFLSERTGSLRSGMFVLVFSIVLLIVLQIVLAARMAPASGRS